MDKKYYHKSKKWSIARHEIYLIMKYVLICNGHGISVILKRELIENDWTGRHKARKIRLKIFEIKCIQTTDWCTWPNTLLSLLLPHNTINWCTRIIFLWLDGMFKMMSLWYLQQHLITKLIWIIRLLWFWFICKVEEQLFEIFNLFKFILSK